MEIVYPFSESMDYSKEFSVKNVIVALCSQNGFGEEGAGVWFPLKSACIRTAPVAVREA